MKKILLNTIIAILSVALAVSIAMLIYTAVFYDVSNDFKTDNDMLYFDLRNELYDEFVKDCYYNKYCGITQESNPEYTDYIEFANYFESAGRYRVYSEMGYEERARRQREQMEEAKSKMTELSSVTDKIDKMLKCENY